MKRVLLIAAALAVVCLGLWLLVRDTGARNERAVAPAGAQPGVESGGVTPNLIPAEIVEPVVEADARTELTAPEPAPTDETATPDGDEAAELRVLVLDVATGEPVPGLGGSLGPLEGRQGRLRSETHADGRLEFSTVPVGVPRLLSIEADFVWDALASLELVSFEPGERRELTLEVDTSVIPAYWFRCVAYEDGRPLAGVRGEREVSDPECSGRGAMPFARQGDPADRAGRRGRAPRTPEPLDLPGTPCRLGALLESRGCAAGRCAYLG